jgi:hypothetical protein
MHHVAAAGNGDIGSAAIVMAAITTGDGDGVRVVGRHQLVDGEQHIARVHSDPRSDAGHLHVADVDQQLEAFTGGEARVECHDFQPE